MPARPSEPPPADPLEHARWVLRAEAATLADVADRLDDRFRTAAERIGCCAGRIAVIGVGKSADVGQKIAGTLNSTGTRSYCLDATRAVHGDLGMVHPDDVALVLSHSGESDELVRLLGPLQTIAAGVVAITGNPQSTLARRADVALVYGPVTEVCPLSLAPSASTTVMLALGDALAFTLSHGRGFTADDFARFHPAGSLGRKLAPVEWFMRRADELRLAPATHTVRAILADAHNRGRRTGAVMLTDADGRLSGLFTDSDLARLFERRHDDALDRPVAEVMTRHPFTVPKGTRMSVALGLFRDRKISELPVIDGDGFPVGLVDITDVIGLLPAEAVAPLRQSA